MHYASLKRFDTQNGPGVRVSLFVSGCTLDCPGCFNREARNFRHGRIFGEAELQQLLAALAQPEVAGLSLLGGEPTEPKNVACVIEICRAVRAACPTRTIWLWSGRLYEDLLAQAQTRELLALVDVLVDGPFIEQEASDTLEYRGSRNQRVIDLAQVRATTPASAV